MAGVLFVDGMSNVLTESPRPGRDAGSPCKDSGGRPVYRPSLRVRREAGVAPGEGLLEALRAGDLQEAGLVGRAFALNEDVDVEGGFERRQHALRFQA